MKLYKQMIAKITVIIAVCFMLSAFTLKLSYGDQAKEEKRSVIQLINGGTNLAQIEKALHEVIYGWAGLKVFTEEGIVSMADEAISTAPKETIQELQKHLQKAVRYQQAKIQKELRKITSDFIEVYALMKQ